MSAGVAGLGAAVGRVPGLAPALTCGGAAFPGLVRRRRRCRRALRPDALAAERGGGAVPLGAALGRAAGFTLLNPHVYLDTVLLLGSVSAALAAGERPGFLLGAALASAAWFSALGYGARLLAPLFRTPVAWRVLDGAVGAHHGGSGRGAGAPGAGGRDVSGPSRVGVPAARRSAILARLTGMVRPPGSSIIQRWPSRTGRDAVPAATQKERCGCHPACGPSAVTASRRRINTSAVPPSVWIRR